MVEPVEPLGENGVSFHHPVEGFHQRPSRSCWRSTNGRHRAGGHQHQAGGDRHAAHRPGKAAIFEDVIGAKDVRKAFAGLDLGRQRTIVDALVTITVNPVGKGTARVFDPDAIVNGRRAVDVVWKEDL
jgi:hypothetical protein